MAELQQTPLLFEPGKILRSAAHLLALAALALNIAASWKVYRHEPLREAASRSLLAANSSWFYDSGMAEPLPVFALKAAMLLGADPDAAVRVEGLAVLVLLFAATVWALSRRLGPISAVIAALLIGANPYFGYYAMQGGSHLYALLFLVLFWAWFDAPGWRMREALLAGAAGGLACLSRLDSAWVLLLLAALTAAYRRGAFRFRQAAAALGVALVLVLPYAAWQAAKFSSPLYAQELGLRRWANVDAHGYAQGAPYLSGPMGPAAFLLRKGPAGAVQDLFGGLGRAFAYEIPRAVYYKFIFVLVFLGLYSAFAMGKAPPLFFLAAVLLPVLPLAPVEQVPASGGIELRYYLAAVWALFALAGLGFQEILGWMVQAAAKAGRPGAGGEVKRK